MPTCNQPRPLALMAALSLALGMLGTTAAGCTEDGLRDMHYGTDVGGSYQLPDGLLDRTNTETRDAVVDAAADAGDTGDTADAAPAIDSGATPDTAADAGPEVLLDAGAAEMAQPTADAAGGG